MIDKRMLSVIAILVTVCACVGQETTLSLPPPLPVNAIAIDADLEEGPTDPQTGDVTIYYTLILKNIHDEPLEKVILRDFQLPSDIVMKQDYFTLENFRPGETRSINFEVIVKGWGLNRRDQEWEIDFTLRIESDDAYSEQPFFYGITLYA